MEGLFSMNQDSKIILSITALFNLAVHAQIIIIVRAFIFGYGEISAGDCKLVINSAYESNCLNERDNL